MRIPRTDPRLSRAVAAAAAVAILGTLGTFPLAAQDAVGVVSKSVSVGRDAARLELEFDRGRDLSIALDDGEVRIDGDVVGDFTTGDALDLAWRTLLGFAVALDDGPLARTLVDWTPPDDLSADAASAAARIDEALEQAFRSDVGRARAPAAEAGGDGASSANALALRSLIALLDRTDRLAGLAEALEDLDLDQVTVSVGDDLTIARDEMVEGTVVVVDGDLEVEGHVRGDVVVVEGDVRLAPGARIDGDLRYLEGRLIDQGGEVAGDVLRIESDESQTEQQIRDEVRSELRSEFRAAAQSDSRRRRGSSPLGRVFGGLGGAIANLFSVLVVGLVGALVVHFAGPNLDAVAETSRRTPGRALMVGTAGAFLILPAFVLGIVALAISIIGIPALILWIPLFPVAVVLGGGLGYLAVARNVGIWVSRQRWPYLGWVRITNPVTLILGGALALTAPFIAAELVSVFPWTGALEVLLVVTATLLSTLAILMGFGAVLLTRGGRRPEFYDDDLFGGWDPGPTRGPSQPSGAPDGFGEGSAWTEPAAESAETPAPEPTREPRATPTEASQSSADADDDALRGGATPDGDESRDDARSDGDESRDA